VPDPAPPLPTEVQIPPMNTFPIVSVPKAPSPPPVPPMEYRPAYDPVSLNSGASTVPETPETKFAILQSQYNKEFSKKQYVQPERKRTVPTTPRPKKVVQPRDSFGSFGWNSEKDSFGSF